MMLEERVTTAACCPSGAIERLQALAHALADSYHRIRAQRGAASRPPVALFGTITFHAQFSKAATCLFSLELLVLDH